MPEREPQEKLTVWMPRPLRRQLEQVGHANISITLDRYGHLMPGTEAEAVQLLDAYLSAHREQAEDMVRVAA